MLTVLCGMSMATQEKSNTLEVYFRQGYSLWESGFKKNGERLEAFVERFKKLREDSILYNVSKIHIIAGCSPEGTWKFNQRLSKNRAKCIRGVLKQHITLPDSVIVEDSRGINWDGLYEMIETLVGANQTTNQIITVATSAYNIGFTVLPAKTVYNGIKIE